MIILEMKNCNIILKKHSNQRQITEQAKFAYSPLESAVKKQTKAIKDQAEQQIKAIKHNKKQLDNKQRGNTVLLISKEREILKNIYNQRFDKMDELSKKK